MGSRQCLTARWWLRCNALSTERRRQAGAFHEPLKRTDAAAAGRLVRRKLSVVFAVRGDSPPYGPSRGDPRGQTRQ